MVPKHYLYSFMQVGHSCSLLFCFFTLNGRKKETAYTLANKGLIHVYEVDHDNSRYSIAYTVINVNKRKLYTFLYSIIPMAYHSFHAIESLFIPTIEKWLLPLQTTLLCSIQAHPTKQQEI